MQRSSAVEELKAAALSDRHEPVSALRFSPSEELLWAGTENGWLQAARIPEVERYSSVRAHNQRVLDLTPMPPSVSNGAVSVSFDTVRYHASGGLPHFTYTADKESDMTACAVDTQSPRKVILGHMSGRISILDLQTAQIVQTVDPVVEGIQILRAPAWRGAVAVGCSHGQVFLADPRANFKHEQLVTAHVGGLIAMDVAGGFIATSGLGMRQGQVVQDTIVKVYDCRATAKVMTTIPFSAGPALLKFHPRFSETLLVAATNGVFTLSQLTGTAYAPMLQVDTEGDLLTTADISSSGECIGFGGSGGFVHLWGYNQAPRVNLRSMHLEIPPLQPEPLVVLEEGDSFALQPLYFDEGKPLSEWDAGFMGKTSCTPRVLDLSAFKDAKQMDFVTYVPNPFFRRRGPTSSSSARLLAPLRNTRLKPKMPTKLRAGETVQGASVNLSSALPAKYRLVHITIDVDRRYEEFDFGKHNHTRFAGLENGIANCYANAVIQVLYFIPEMREFLLGSVPDPNLEFSLLDELGLLFRMLASESGHPCQATNLLRALRQSREATGLGLLEGHAQKGAHGADIEVEANKDRSLSRRVQSLQRFLLDKLHHEAVKRQSNSGSIEEAHGGSKPPKLEAHKGEPDLAERSPQEAVIEPAESGRVDSPADEDGKGTRKESVCSHTSVVEQLFGIRMTQRMQSLQSTKSVVEREARAFQIDLQYPRRSKKASSSPQPDSSPVKPTGVVQQVDEPRPSFGDILEASLKSESETRAWFNDQLKYQYVKQTRVPLAWPEVLALGTGLQDPRYLDFWQPLTQGGLEKTWAPWALTLELKDGRVTVQESEEPLQAHESLKSEESLRASYELTAVVALVKEEEADLRDYDKGRLQAEEGHLVAHVKVPLSYRDGDLGLMPTPKAPLPSPGLTPHTYFRPALQSTASVGLPGWSFRKASEEPFGEAQEKEGAAEEHGLPEDPFGGEDSALPQDPDGTLEAAGASSMEVLQELTQQEERGESPSTAPSGEGAQVRSYGKEAEMSGSGAAAVVQQFSNLKVTARRSASLAHSGQCQPPEEDTWLLINDFSIGPTSKDEVLQLMDGHKIPCLLYYTQVSNVVRNETKGSRIQQAPALDTAAFHRLCRAPPLQVSMVGVANLAKPSFWPLSPEEGPQEGMLLGLDAEFVAFSPPTKSFRGGVEIETAPSRLGLARVSVVRGEGLRAGRACIDDYIRTTEPVYDYLTQYSGLHAGDLDPVMSPHHLTTTKAAYLKLRFLVDCGCIFVGHGLKKDFRMINIVVPTAQIIDTVDLFYLKRQRKLSLRFLAAYLLNQDIQKVTHDSVEDSRTALSLYKMYKRLESEGRVREVIQEMYAWGKQHGWDPNTLKEHYRHEGAVPLQM